MSFKSNKVSCAKLFFKNIDFTTLLVIVVRPKKWKIRHFGIKQIHFTQLIIRIQKSDFIKRTKKISDRVHFRGSFAPPECNFFFYSKNFDTNWNAGSCECDAIFQPQIWKKKSKSWNQNGGHIITILDKNTENWKIPIVGSKIYKMCIK